MPLKIETHQEHYRLLTISRPEALNAINQEIMEGLLRFFTEEKENPEIRGVVIVGEGQKAFVAGADISGFLKLDAADAFRLTQLGHNAYRAIETFHVPVIAAVNGFALGGGCELAMACHLRIAVPTARFGQPEVNLGLVPGYGGSQRLPNLVGKGRALELLLTGDMIDATKALDWGLVNQLADADKLLETCFAWLDKISSKGPAAISTVIELVNQSDGDRSGFESEVKKFADLLLHPEALEGISAFLEKRKANFR